MKSQKAIKAQVQGRFAATAERYVSSRSHAAGEDLERLVALAAPQPGWRVLDVATGGGHTTLRFAPLVAHVVALDLTPTMLSAARRFITDQLTAPEGEAGDEAPSIAFIAGDAEALPFPTSTFDLITCRIAPHHFPDCYRFVNECARVLRPDGTLLIEDNTVPDEARAARYIDSFERLRDPGHQRCYAGYEWEGMFLDAGLRVKHLERLTKPAVKLLQWAQTQSASEAVIEHLHVLLRQAPPAVREWMHPQASGTPDATFDHHYTLIKGRKPSAAG
jgi:ubiquinone/menaquinone biosynthesis C-methylase UbiE